MLNVVKKFKFLHKITEIKNNLISNFNHFQTFQLIKKILFSFLILDTFITLPIASQLWGKDAFIPFGGDRFTGVLKVFDFLSSTELSFLYIVFLIGKIIFLFLSICNIIPFISSILAYICLLNLNNKSWVILNGGDNILHIVFIYLILMELGQNNSIKKLTIFQEIGNVIANFAFYSARLQIVLIYVVAGLTKLQSHLWRDGVALYYVLNTREFTHPFAQKIFLSSDVLIMLGTYGTLIFQLSFPWLVWNQKVKKYVLFVGTIIHLQISFVMGLFEFGIIVSLMYWFFLTETEGLNLKNRLMPSDKLYVGFDHNCKICLQFANFVKFFDYNDLIQIDSAQNPKNSELEKTSIILRMDKIGSTRESDGKLFFGFDTLYEIFRRVPALLPIRIVLRILKPIAGDLIYKLISRNFRKKVGCYNDRNNSCSI